MDFSFTFYIWMRWMMCFELYQNHIHSVRWLWMKIGSSRGSSTKRETFFVCVRRPKDTACFQHHSLHALCVDTNRDPRPKSVQCWIGTPFFVLYLIAMFRNASLLIIIKWDPSLHEPKYMFPGMLAVTDIVLLPSIVPNMSCTRNIFWFLPASNVAHSHISGHRIRHLAGHGPGPLCSHLLSTQKCCHLTHFLVTQIAAAVTQDCHSCSSILSTDKVPVSVLL